MNSIAKKLNLKNKGLAPYITILHDNFLRSEEQLKELT